MVTMRLSLALWSLLALLPLSWDPVLGATSYLIERRFEGERLWTGHILVMAKSVCGIARCALDLDTGWSTSTIIFRVVALLPDGKRLARVKSGIWACETCTDGEVPANLGTP
jgi:hypothetical protein